METPPHLKSWIHLTMALEDNDEVGSGPSADRATPEYAELLREAQRDSTQNSAMVSLTSSKKNSPRDTPKSPPNSPVNEWTDLTDPPGYEYYINHGLDADLSSEIDSDQWTDNYSSRPDQTPPRYLRYVHPNGTKSLRRCYIGRSCIFDRQIICSFAVTNIAMLLIGIGLGYWWTKRGAFNNQIEAPV